MGIGKSRAPAAPNYAPLIAAQTEAAGLSQQIGMQQLDWGRDQNQRNSALADGMTQRQIETMEAQNRASDADRARYADTFQPVEDDYLAQIRRYSDPQQMDSRAASAAGDVSQQFEVGRDNARRQLEAYGVDPTQTRAAALDLGTRTQEAAARASAMNVSRRTDEQTAQGQRLAGIQIGQNTINRAQQETGLGLQAGNSALNNRLQASTSGAALMGTPQQYLGLQNQSLGQAANTMNQGFQNQLAQFNANNAQSSGIGGLVGTVAGAAFGNPAIGGAIGRGISGVFGRGSDSGLPNLNFGFEDGGAVPGAPERRQAIQVDRGGYVPEDIQAGIKVDRGMSPSGGAETDDVPARLNVGEFVLPADYVRWVGERSLQRDIAKSKEERTRAQAQPRMMALPVERPVVNTTGALDVRR